MSLRDGIAGDPSSEGRHRVSLCNINNQGCCSANVGNPKAGTPRPLPVDAVRTVSPPGDPPGRAA
ncbi:hypothetical protein GCM10009581_35570 [Tsukamurella strandjordii]